MIKKKSRAEIREKKHRRLRNRYSGTPERPRLCVFRSNLHIYAQVIDDVAQKTLCAAGTVEKEIAYVAKFIADHSEDWAEIQVHHKETVEHFKQYENSGVCKDGSIWIFSDNGWD